MRKYVLKIGFKNLELSIKGKQLLLLILFLISISGNLKSEETFQWVKGDSVWKMNNTVSGVKEAKLLGSDRFITYSVDSIIRIFNLESGNLLNSYKVNEKYTEFKFCEEGENYIITNVNTQNGYVYEIGLKLFDSENGNLLGKGFIDNNFLRSALIQEPLKAITFIKFVASYYNKIKNELLFGFDVSMGGAEYKYQVSKYTGALLSLKKANDTLVIQKGGAGGQLTRKDERNGKVYFVSSIGEYWVPENGRSYYYDSYFSINNETNQFSDIFEVPATIQGIYIRDLIINFESKINNLSYIFYKADSPQLNGFIKLPEDKISLAEIIEIPTNITPYYLTKNDQYIVTYINNYPTPDIVGFFSPLSKKFDISFPADPESGTNFILGNNEKNLVLHISNTNTDSFIKVYNLNNIMKELNISADRYKIPIGDKVKMAAFMNTKGKDYKWYVNGMEINQTGAEIEYLPQNPGFYDVNLIATDVDGNVYEVTKQKFFEVQDSLIADFDIEFLNNEIPLKVKLTNKSRGSFTSWSWDFGDGSLPSSEQNPVHEYNFPGDFSPRLIINNDITSDTVTKFEKILIKTPVTEDITPIISSKENTDNKTFRNVFLTNDGFVIGHNYVESSYKDPFFESSVYADFITYDFLFFKLNKFTVPLSNETSLNPINLTRIGFFEFIRSDKNTLGILCNYYTTFTSGIDYYDMKSGNRLYFENISYNIIYNVKKVYNYSDSTFICNMIVNNKSILSKTDLHVKTIWSTPLSNSNVVGFYSDTLKGTTQVLNKYNSIDYEMFSVSNDGNILYNKSFKLDTNITISNIKSVNENLILIYGDYKDITNKTTYGYLAKFNPIDNTIIDTILYSRQNIRKIEKINNQYFAAIGQNRCRQGYLILDTNLHQIKDIRVVDLTGTMQECIVYNSKVYLFTEKIVSIPTPSLTYKNSYQTTSSVLELPQDILADVVDKPDIVNSNFNFSIYPNPATDYLEIHNDAINPTLKHGVDNGSDIQIFDMLGIDVSPAGGRIKEGGMIDISNLSPGMYFIKIGNRVEKFVKI
jgi:PKD repeat protein